MEEATKLIKQIRNNILELYEQMNKDLEKKTGEKQHFEKTNKYISDFAEWFAAKQMGLILAKVGEKGYDAKDSEGNTYEIKHFKQRENGKITSAPGNANKKYNFLVVVILNERDYTPRGVYSIPKKIADECINKDAQNGSFRWSERFLNIENYEQYRKWPK